ncbi:uncharacterized protein LOC111830212 [Capsella rubella]|uniref:uncharacterized protein LOC111830212 n=1 Tax=Capsella rubella TaxID=81985 RepID=UPI000CD5064F|nr:uncharacterized protein LOC111830212 [Capsella rubella]
MIVNKIWRLGDKSTFIDVYEVNDNTVKFRIRNESMRNRILNRGMWNIMDIPMIVSKWTPFAEEQPAMKSIPLWITLKNVPPSMFTHKGLEFLSSAVGKPIRLHPKTEACVTFEEAQILVEADLTKELPQEYFLTGEEEGELDTIIMYSYPWLPPRCICCKKWGHASSTCLTKPREVQTAPGSIVALTNVQEIIPEVVSEVAVLPLDTVIVEQVERPQVEEQNVTVRGEEEWTTPKSSCSPGKSTESFKFGELSILSNSYSVLEVEGDKEEEDMPREEESIQLHSVIKKWVGENEFQFGCLLETRVKERKAQWLGDQLLRDWTMLTNYEFNCRGRIWIMWRDTARLTPFFKSAQLVTCSVQLQGQEGEFFCSFIYASNCPAERKELWRDLRDHCDSTIIRNKPWMIFGDFNVTLAMVEHSRVDVTPEITAAMRDFQEVVNDCSLQDMSFQGPLYTWCNKREDDLIMKKLDRVMVNDKWLQAFPHAYNVFDAGGCSDHLRCRIMIKGDNDNAVRSRKLFKFVNVLTEMEEFKPLVENYWKETESLFLSTSTLFRFSKKCKGLKSLLRSLAKERLGHLVKKTKEAFDRLCLKQEANLSNPSAVLMAEENEAYQRWDFVAGLEEKFLKQTSKLHWLQVGDKNNKIFHRAAAVRKAKNNIKEIKCQDGRLMEKVEEIKIEAERHFREFLQFIPSDFVGVAVDELEELLPFRCSEEENQMLTAVVTGEEIKKVLFAMPSNKSPGPDGYTAEFYKATWGIIGVEFTLAIQSFFAKGFLPKGINSTILALIPKNQGACEMKDYRPISCCNVIYKVISKIIANRLKKVLPKFVSGNQSAFVQDRLLIENVLLAMELVKDYHKDTITSRCAIKIDISKAFDSVQWSFLSKIFTAMRFPPTFIQWIILCVSTASFSVQVNGELAGYFRSSREQIRNRVSSWTVRHLSFAGRLNLISSVLWSTCNFWLSAFRLPRACISEVEKICSSFLWSGQEMSTHRAKISWGTVCKPKQEGGLGLRSLHEANNYRGLAKPLAKMDVGDGNHTSFWYDDWSHMGRLVELVDARVVIDMGIGWGKSLAWAWSRRRRRHRSDLLNSIEETLYLKSLTRTDQRDVALWKAANDSYKPRFSTKDTWNHIRTASSRVAWGKGVWFSHATPKFTFCVWLAVHDRLPTGEKMVKWSRGLSGICEFCQQDVETRDHLFFACSYASEIWASTAKGLLLSHYTTDWTRLIALISTPHQDRVHTFLLRYAFQAVVYGIWRERNCRRHGNAPIPPPQLTKMIDKQVRDQLSSIRKMGDLRYAAGFQLWLQTRT